MTCTIFGPGLVGSYLGIAAGARTAVPGSKQRPTATTAKLPSGMQTWQPALVTQLDPDQPLLVCTRWNDTPWRDLPSDVLAAQNGLGQPRNVAVCFFALDLTADGSVTHVGPPPRIVVQVPTPRWQAVFARWRQAGIVVDEVANIQAAQWEKAILNATVGPLCRATGLSMAAVWAHPQWQPIILAATREGIRIAHASGIAVDPTLDRRAATFFSTAGHHQPSILKHAGELPVILDPLLNTAERYHIAAPALTRIASAVEHHAVFAAKG